ncbi:M20/M25/M40 family metallo-hydrolase [Hydrogenophaga sp. 5NK40-0174]|uniref:M20/M25/M40 family metallo-hydrolase n=1 Tax=Hydrogenophaga sp. 5NK40-0174 TaxID=3127649 RepID=UPI0033422288
MSTASDNAIHARLDAWVEEHFGDQTRFLQALVRVPTDTPPGNNAPHALRTAELLAAMGLDAEQHAVPEDVVKSAGLKSITNLVVRQRFADTGPVIALNAHGDVVPPGEGWTHDPYGGEIEDGMLFGRAAAVSKSDFASFTFALRALLSLALPLRGGVELHFTYDEEFGGELGPGWLLEKGIVKPDFLVAAGFSHQVVVAHNGCLQLEVTVEGEMAHAAIPDTGTDALQGANHILNALYPLNAGYLDIRSGVDGIDHPYLNIGLIQGGTNTNVVPGKVVIKLDRRMLPEEDPETVEASLRQTIADAAASFSPPRGGKSLKVTVRRMLLAKAMKPLPGHERLSTVIQRHASALFGEDVPAVGTPLYTDARLYAARGIPAVIYGAGPHTVLESHAKRADERLALSDLKAATQVLARSLYDWLKAD